MKVLIAGAGVGGLATALSLSAAGIKDVQIIEAASEILALGVGINLLPHAVRELHELGLADELDEAGVESRSVKYFDRYGSEIATVPRGFAAGYDWPAYTYHRGALQQLLLRRVRETLGTEAVVTGAKLSGFDQSPDGVNALVQTRQGAQESVYKADILVAADGVNSTVRKLLYPSEGEPQWNGNIMYRGVTQLGHTFLDGHTQIYGGYFDQRFLAYPIRTPEGQTVLNWGATAKAGTEQMTPEDWNRETDRDLVCNLYRGWGFAGIDFAEVIATAETVYEYPQVDRDPLPKWSFNRVTLLGDAAHPMQPTGSNGTSQAILDARILAYVLASSDAPEHALQEYDKRRIRETTQVVLASRQMADARILQTVYERAPQGFDSIDSVISQDEIRQSIHNFQSVAGYEPETLRERPSLSTQPS